VARGSLCVCPGEASGNDQGEACRLGFGSLRPEASHALRIGCRGGEEAAWPISLFFLGASWPISATGRNCAYFIDREGEYNWLAGWKRKKINIAVTRTLNLLTQI